MKNVCKRCLSAQHGLSLIQVMAIGAALATMIVIMGRNLESIKKSSSAKEKANNYRSLALGSLVYAQYLLEQRKCINLATGLTNASCNGLWDSGNLERLLLFPKTINDINNRFTAYKSNPVSRINKLKIRINRDRVNSDHPLHPLMTAKGLKNVKEVLFEFSSEYDAKLGDVNKVFIDVSIYAEVNGVMGKTTKNMLKARRKILVYPRNINYFSLALNGDLVIGENNNVSSSERPVRKNNQFNFDVAGKGMTFHSPVFVNGGIYLPKKDDQEVKNVEFRAPIYVGNSVMTSDNQPFVPEVDAKNEILSNYPSYKGILSGIVRTSSEPSLDNLFSKDYAGTNPTLASMQTCISYAYRRFDRSATMMSRILVKKGSGANELIFGLSKLNEFITVRKVSQRTDGESYFNLKASGNSPKMGVRLEWRDYKDNDHEKLNTQMAVGDELEFKDKMIKELFEFYEYTTYDATAHKCVKDTSKSVSSRVKDENYPDVEIALESVKVNGVTALNRVSLDLNIDYKESLNVTVHSSGSLPNVACGLKGRWRNRPELFIRAYNFRENPYAPASVRDDDWGGPNYGQYDTKRKIGFTTYDQNQKLAIDRNSYDNEWRYLTPNHHIAGLSQKEKDSLSDSVTPVDFFQYCQANEPTGEKVSSTPSAIDIDFSKSAFVSWNYNPISKDFQYKPGTSDNIFWSQIFNKNSNRMFLNELVITDANDVLFHVYAIVDRCIVKSSASTVNGFLVCRHMIIKSRDKKLQMLGSFVIDKLTVHPSAVKAGVDWKNVHRKDTQEVFRKLGILNEDNICNVDSSNPHWFKLAEDEDKVCNTSALSVSADPFIWTSFNPSCGLENQGDLVTKCKPYSRARNFVSVILQESYEL